MFFFANSDNAKASCCKSVERVKISPSWIFSGCVIQRFNFFSDTPQSFATTETGICRKMDWKSLILSLSKSHCTVVYRASIIQSNDKYNFALLRCCTLKIWFVIFWYRLINELHLVAITHRWDLHCRRCAPPARAPRPACRESAKRGCTLTAVTAILNSRSEAEAH